MKTIIASALFLLPAAGYCGDSSFGQLASVEPSVRANALADAGTAGTGDTFGFFYNPALGAPRSVAATYQHGYSDGDGTGVFAATLPQALKGIDLGVGFAYYNAGDLTMYSNTGTAATFNAEKDWLLVLNGSKKLNERFSVGAALKEAHISLFDAAHGNAALIDAGVQVHYPFADLGFAIQNIGQSMKLGTKSESFTSDWRLGAARSIAVGANTINATVDFVKYKDETGQFRVGGEFIYNKSLSFRLGYRFRNKMADADTLLYGLGYTYRNWTADYALVPYLNLGSTHRLSLEYKF